MIIKNGLVWEESGSFLTKDLHIDSDTHRIAMDAADTTDDTIIDASGLYVIPGLAAPTTAPTSSAAASRTGSACPG